MIDLERDFVHLIQLISTDKTDDAQTLIRRTLRFIGKQRPDLADEVQILSKRLGSGPITRNAATQALPVDTDTRLELLRLEAAPTLDIEPTWPASVLEELDATIAERAMADDLRQAGLAPTRSLLFIGPPGVGKTLAARWLSMRLERPLLTLDLAAVMSSYLGRTGNNIRAVLEYARRTPSVLLLDEFDAIAKRRDDLAEIGELKRLVTVLLQQVDEWPPNQLLLCATNHPELLDTAVWRRFDRVVQFPLPAANELMTAMCRLVFADEAHSSELSDTLRMLAVLYEGQSFAEITRRLTTARRHAVVHGEDLASVLALQAQRYAREASRERRAEFAAKLGELGYSQRQAAKAAGVGRDTLRKRAAKESTETMPHDTAGGSGGS